MKEEIGEGVNFLRQFLAKYGQMNQAQIDEFGSRLTGILEKRYANHWYESNPMKGQAFRCLRLKKSEKYVDPTIESILSEMRLSLNQLGLPDDFTLWIDPGEVSVRFGDLVGYTYTIAKLEKGVEREAADEQAKLVVHNSEKIFDDKLTAFIRQNSSNHKPDDLGFSFNDLQINSDTSSALPIEKRTISPPLNKRANSSTMPIYNRLSGTDTSYFSSSSSSCASSFGSEHNNLSWFPNSDLFSVNTDQVQNNLNLLNFDFIKSALNSETSSERSDTPNSSVTNSSYFGNFSFAFDGIFPNETSLDSSGSSTSTTVFNQTETDDVQTPKKVSDSEEEKIKSSSPKSNKKPEPKRDSSYCGYVESFPYYYKLNRLYNALALQKMQTERLKKAGLLNQSNMNNPVAVAQAWAAFQSMSLIGSSPTGSQLATSPPKTKQRNFKNKKYTQSLQQQAQQKNF